jgi:hypothetical protein
VIEDDDKPTQVGAMSDGGNQSFGSVSTPGERTPFDVPISASDPFGNGFGATGERETVAGNAGGAYSPAFSGANLAAGGERETTVNAPATSAPRHVAWLYCTQGLRGGQFYHLRHERNELGREADYAVFIEDRFASARHGAIVQRDGQWHFFDFASTNGTTINARPVGSEVENPVLLEDGDVIGIGDSEFVFKKI